MSDITMCSGQLGMADNYAQCAIRKTCLRFVSTVGTNQSWMNPPLLISANGEQKCYSFWQTADSIQDLREKNKPKPIERVGDKPVPAADEPKE